MEYVKERGNYTDVLFKLIMDDFRKYYPKWLANGSELSSESNDLYRVVNSEYFAQINH